MTNRTLGPWHVNDIETYIKIRGPNNEAIANVFPFSGRGGVGRDVSLLNATLIAAAPDILEALHALMKSTEELCTEINILRHPSVENARAAIAKAEGRSS